MHYGGRNGVFRRVLASASGSWHGIWHDQVSFFELPRVPEPDEPPTQPVWAGPPDNETGIVVPLNRVLARGEEVAVRLLSATTFSTGFELAIAVRTREPIEALHESFAMQYRRRKPAELEPAFFRFGLEFADGRKATNLGYPGSPLRGDSDPSQPVVVPRGSAGGNRRWDGDWWVWPLPPAGPLSIVCEWPAYGIALTGQEFDAGMLLDASALVEQLWPAR
jgi:hypothetical protein